jgi:hypothetical protein
MRPAIRLLALSLVFAGTAVAEAPKKPKDTPKPPAPKKVDPLANTKMLAPIQVDSLTLTPLVGETTTAAPKVDVLVLDEAMAAKKVRIQEIEDESVNNLTFINKSEQPVFLLAGEVIIGGKQDRIIGANTVIPANTTQTVPVFCVEHGRWDNKTNEFTTAKALAHGRLRGRASFKTQSDVWSEVAATNELKKTKSDTDTYRQVATKQSDGSLSKWQKRIDDALAKVPTTDRDKMIGYVVAVNGKVATVDMFQSPLLFKKLEPKLLKSYVTDAVDVAAAKDVKAPSQKQVLEFMDDSEKAAEENAYSTKAAKSLRKTGKVSGKSTVVYDFGNDAVEGAAKPAPAAVYQNYSAW